MSPSPPSQAHKPKSKKRQSNKRDCKGVNLLVITCYVYRYNSAITDTLNNTAELNFRVYLTESTAIYGESLTDR